MAATAVNETDSSASVAGNRLPARYPVQAAPDAAQTSRATTHRRPIRPMAAFLAQLSLQYDGTDVAHKRRRERMETAAHRYGEAASAPCSDARGRRRDFRI
jgi:hypothetical protein